MSTSGKRETGKTGLFWEIGRHMVISHDPKAEDIKTTNIVLKGIMEWEKAHRKDIDKTYRRTMAELYDISEAIKNIQVLWRRIERLQGIAKNLIETTRGTTIQWSN